MQCPQVQGHESDNHEGQQEVKGIEADECRVVDRETAPHPADQRLPDHREGRKEVGDHGCGPVAHLPPGQHVSHERGRHHRQEDHQADPPQHLAGSLVGSVIEAPEDVQIDDDEEERCAVGVRVADQPAVIDIAHDPLDTVEGHVRVRRVVHREHDARHDLQHERDSGKRTEVPHVVEVARRRVVDEVMIGPAQDRQAPVEPAHETVVHEISHGPRPGQPMTTVASSVKT